MRERGRCLYQRGDSKGSGGEPPAPWEVRGCSSDGRAPALQAGGRQFESAHLHQHGGPEGRSTADLATGNGLIAQVVRAHA